MTLRKAVFARRSSWAPLLLGSALTLTGCTVSTGGSVDPARGNLTVSWTITSGSDPLACTTAGATSLILQLSDATGLPYGAPRSEPCSSFTATVTDLPPGTYNVSGYLVNAANQPLTGTVAATPVVVNSGLTTYDSLAFPSTAFTTPPVSSTTGSVALTWVVASTVDPAQCAANGAANLVVQLTTTAGQPYGAPLTVPCTAFTASIASVPPGVYALSAQMVNGSGQPASTAVGPVQVTVVAGAASAQALDFPASAFIGAGTTTGSLTATWTVAGTTDLNQCTAHGAVNISIQLVDANGTPVGAASVAPCGAFAATVANLAPGSYGVTAQLVDAANQPVSTTVGPVPVNVVAGGAGSMQAFAFPADAFTR